MTNNSHSQIIKQNMYVTQRTYYSVGSSARSSSSETEKLMKQQKN